MAEKINYKFSEDKVQKELEKYILDTYLFSFNDNDFDL